MIAAMTDPVPRRAEIVVDLAAIRHNVAHPQATWSARRAVQLMAVVKADGYGHGMVGSPRPPATAGADWLGVATIDEALALRAAGDTGPLLCWLSAPGDDYAAAVAAGVDVTAYSVAELDEIAARSARRPACSSRSTPASPAAAPRAPTGRTCSRAAATRERDGPVTVTGVWSHFAASDEPAHPANDAQEAAFREALDLAEQAGLDPEVAPPRQLGGARSCARRRHFDLVRCGIASTASTRRPASRPRPRPAAGDDRAAPGSRWSSRSPPATASPTATPGPPTATPPSALVPVGYGDGVPRHAGNTAAGAGRRPRRPIRGRVCMDQFVVDLDGELPPAGDEVVLFGPGDRGEPTAQDWAEARRHHQLRDRHPGRRPAAPGATSTATRPDDAEGTPMSIKGRIFGAVVGAAGLAAAGGGGRHRPPAAGVIGNRAAGERRRRSARCARAPRVVVADDGVDLHVEIDEPEPTSAARAADRRRPDRRLRPRLLAQPRLLALPARAPTAARSARSSTTSAPTAGPAAPTQEHCTIDQLGHDLRRVIEDTVPGPVRARRPLDGRHDASWRWPSSTPSCSATRSSASRLISTTAGGLDPGRILFPMLPLGLGGRFVGRAVRTLDRGHRVVDVARAWGHAVADVVTDRYAFGERRCPAATSSSSTRCSTPRRSRWSRTSTRPSRRSTSSSTSSTLGRVPTAIICGTEDKITSVGHSRKLHSRIPGSSLLECEGAGHMVLLERHKRGQRRARRPASRWPRAEGLR